MWPVVCPIATQLPAKLGMKPNRPDLVIQVTNVPESKRKKNETGLVHGIYHAKV
jgi:hypothetical protein